MLTPLFSLIEFVGLRPKLYSILSEAGEKKTAKGICRRVVKRSIHHSDYRECLFGEKETSCNMKRITSIKHNLYTVSQNKKALSACDNKKYILAGGIKTLAYGHYYIKKFEESYESSN